MSPESKAQELTWALKREAWRDVEHFPLEDAIAKRLESAAAAVQEMGLKRRARDPRAGHVPAVQRD